MFSFLAAQYGPVADIEVIWVALSFVGFLFSLFNIREARRDRIALRLAGLANGRKKIADYGLANEVIRAVVQFIFVVIGILAMTVSDGVNTADLPWNLALLRVTITWGLIIATSLVSLKSVMAWQLRKTLREQIETNFSGITSAKVEGQITVAPTEDGENLTATLKGSTEEK